MGRSARGDGAGSAPPRVTVVVPAFNAAERIGRCLDSLASQTFRDFEVVVVDDGSTDDTAAVVCRHPWVRTVRQSNQGPGSARRVGLRCSTSEYVAFIDDDDEWKPTRLQRCVDVADASPEIAFVTTDAYVMTPDGVEQGTYYSSALVFPERERQLAAIARHNFVFSSCLVRREAYDSVGGFCAERRLTGAEDYDLWLRMLLAGHHGVCIDEPLAVYRSRPDGLSQTDPLRNERVRLQVLGEYLPRLWQLGVDGSPRDNVQIALGHLAAFGPVAALRHLRAARRAPGMSSAGVARLVARSLRSARRPG